MFRISIYALLLTLLTTPLSIAAPTTYWNPLSFDGGVELKYEFKQKQAQQELALEITIEFIERFDYDYDLVATVRIDGELITATEQGIGNPSIWAMEQLEKGPITANRQNLPLAIAQNLSVSSMILFFGISKEQSEWDRGFSMPHPNPNLSGATFTAMSSTCSAAGLTGKTQKVERNIAEKATACISSDIGLPLSFRREHSTEQSEDYRLISYRPNPLNPPRTYYQGEPDGFDGIKWATDKSNVSGLVLKSTPHEKIRVYERKDQRQRFWGVDFNNIQYHFHDQKFSQATATARGTSNWQALKNTLYAEYGNPDMERSQLLDGIDEFVWDTGNMTRISITYPGTNDMITLTINSVTIEQEAWQGLIDELFEVE